MADLLLRLIAEDAASGAFDSVGGAVKKAAAIFYDFTKESLRAAAEGERAQKQLARAAGENTAAFTAMAEAMSEELAVEDEHIKNLQTLALNYEVLPRQVEGATRAVLDYAAATGRDAAGAMQQLINGVEAGNGTLGRMGVTFQATGDKAVDMQRAIEALSGKFGGAAATDADTMEGRVRRASIAWGELKESFGGFMATVEAKTGAMAGVTHFLQDINKYGFLEARGRFDARQMGMEEKLYGKSQAGTAPGLSQDSPWHTPHLGTSYGKGVEVSLGELSLAPAQKKGGGGASGRSDFGWGPWGNPESSFDGWLEEYQQYGQAKIDAMNAQSLKEAGEAVKRYQREMEEEEKHDEAMLTAHRKASDIELKYMVAETDKQAVELQRRTDMWLSVGMQIGQAVINGIFEAIQLATSDNGDESKAQIKIVQGLFNTLFSAFGMGWMSQTAFGAMNAAESGGGFSAAGVFGGGVANGLSGTNVNFGYDTPSQHSGGWIQKFHRGGWVRDDEVPAVLQTGERVLSRAEVARMGGGAGVESAVRGGRGGGQVVIQAFDSTSLLDFYGDRGGRGMLNAARANVGPLRLMFGKV
jgi:hypothetical protein